MKSNVCKFVSTLYCSAVILAFSNSVMAADWSWAEDEIINSNFGQAAGWVIDGLTFEGGEEYIVTDDLGSQAVCRDYLITVDKHRDANPRGRGKYQEVTEVEIETFCQPLEDEPV